MGGGVAQQPEHSSPLLQDGRSLRAAAAQSSPGGPTPRGSSFSYRLPTFPRNISICQLAGGASEEESAAHKRMQRKLIAALCLAFVFMIVEVVGGVMAHSLAIITDAAHLLSDVSGFAVAVLAAYWAKRRSAEVFSYGYHRVEVLGALASVMTVWLVTGVLLFEAVQRIITPEPVNGKLMFIIAVIGVAVNVVMLLVLGHQHGGHSCDGGHGHSHGGSDSHSHAHGHSCSGHGHAHGKNSSKAGGGKRQLGVALQASAEMSRSSSRAEEGCCDHGHSHSHGHAHAHSHSNAAVQGDLEAGHSHEQQQHHSSDDDEQQHNHAAAPHRHHHNHSSDDEEAQALHSGRSPILAVAARSHEACEGGDHQGHSHGGEGGSGGHDHANLNMRGAIIHVIGDFVQSVGVAIAGALIWWHQDNPSWYIADPICTFLFAALVLWTTRAILRDIGDVLMERVPRGLCIKTIHDDLSRVEGVESVSDLHVWSLTPGIPLLCAHVNLSAEADPTDALHALTRHCRSLGIQHSTIQLMSCGAECAEC